MKGHGKRGQWWVLIDYHNIKYPSVGRLRVDAHNHYSQIYARGRKKSDDLIQAINNLGVVIIAHEELLPSGVYKRKTPDGHIGLFEVLNFKVTYTGMLKLVEFDVGECVIPLDG